MYTNHMIISKSCRVIAIILSILLLVCSLYVAPVKEAKADTLQGVTVAKVVTSGNSLNYAYAITTSGCVYSWGCNSYDSVGNGSTSDQLTPYLIPNLLNVSNIIIGDDATYAITKSGQVYSWGENNEGGVGNNSTTAQLTPYLIPYLSNISTIYQEFGTNFAITTSGSVYAWGNNSYKTVGTGTTSPQLAPTLIPGLSNIVKLYFYLGTMFAINKSGQVYAWGDNSDGQIGNGTTTLQLTPVLVQNISGAVNILHGYHCIYVLTSTGAVYAWGTDNSWGQLGNGTTYSNLIPTMVQGLSNISNIWVTGLYGNTDTVFALNTSGQLYIFGYNDCFVSGNSGSIQSTPYLVSSITNIIKVVPFDSQICVLTAQGKVYTWGENYEGELGNGTTTAQSTPYLVSGIPNISTIYGYDSGQKSTFFAVTSSGSLYTWGANQSGMVGNSATSNQLSPVLVNNITNISKLTFNYLDVCAVTTTGCLYMWGYNLDGRIGNGSVSNQLCPYKLSIYGSVSDTEAWFWSSYVLTTTGSVYAWGNNQNGGIGNGTTTNQCTPYRISFIPGIVSLSTSSSDSTAVLESNGQVYDWGLNSKGQLGNSSTTTQSTPGIIAGLANISSIVSGNSVKYAITSTGLVYAWGSNQYGSVGNNSTTNQLSPVLVPTISDIVNLITVGNGTTYAITSTGQVYSWGYNAYGCVGNNSTTNQLTPYLIPSLSGIVSIVSDGMTTLALTSSGTVYAWGYSIVGEVGNGSTSTCLTPYLLTSLSNVVSLIESNETSYAITSSGTVFAWGGNSNGQIGNGTQTNQLTPYKISVLSGVVQVTFGGYAAYAVTSSGSLYGWGLNRFGEVGDGTTTTRLSPQLISNVSNVLSVSTSMESTGALTTSGAVYTWGSNTNYITGSGTSSTAQTTPYRVNLSGYICNFSLISGACFAISNTGAVYSWGSNTSGNIGNGTTSVQSVPYSQSTVNNVISGLFEADDCNYVITANGLIYSWGCNSSYKVGNGNTTNQLVPYLVFGDATPPTGSYTLNKSGWTAGPEIITVTAVDSNTGVAFITLPTGTIVTASTATLKIFSNGEYDFILTDNAGNSCVFPVVINNIDNSISVTHTISSAYTFDPNSGLLSIPDTILINNNQHVGLDVQLKWNPSVGITDVAANYASPWSVLSRIATTSYVAFSTHIDASSSSGWASIANPGEITATNQSNYTDLGVLSPGGQGNLGYSISAGLAWPITTVVNHSYVLEFAAKDAA